jgi:hypothetical protein
MPRPHGDGPPVHPPEKHQHLDHLNSVLSAALEDWNPEAGSEVVIKFVLTVSPNPGGVSQYHCVLMPGP